MMSSLYIAASGMKSYSYGMQTISHNLANTSTIGYKQSMTMYMDTHSDITTTPSNHVTNYSQPGTGVNISLNRTLFTEGGFESGSSVTDLAINGIGYFGVVKDGMTHYTRAGNFRFDVDGNLLDPNGYNLLGKKITNGVMDNTATPINIATAANATSAPKATTSLQILSNIATTDDKSTNANNPFFSLASSWDGTATPPLGGGTYAYSEPTVLYDAAGKAHNATIYYDYAGTQNGQKVYEYTVGINPTEDGSSRVGTKSAGLLMAGTMTFTSNGQLSGLTGFTPTGSDPSVLTDWSQAGLQNGIPTFPATFSGQGQQTVSLDFGLSLASGWDPSITSPTVGGTNPTAFYGKTPGAQTGEYSSTSYGTNSFNRQTQQDGHAIGYLKSLAISGDGTVSAQYSNSTTEELYQISLYHFRSYDGLKREGSNHFSVTEDSGPAIEGSPGTVNFGSISSTMLEQSNVDMTREFTQMIITQRAFQINSKAITTSDTMLQRALELKR